MTAQTVAVRVTVVDPPAEVVQSVEQDVPPLSWAGTLRQRTTVREWGSPVGSLAFLATSCPLVLAVAGPGTVFVGYSLTAAGAAMAWDSWLTRHTRRWRVKPVWPGREGRTVAVGVSHGAQEEG